MSQSEDFRFNVYGDPHRLFVQAMMCRGVIDSKEFKPLFDLCLKRCKSKLDVSILIRLFSRGMWTGYEVRTAAKHERSAIF